MLEMLGVAGHQRQILTESLCRNLNIFYSKRHHKVYMSPKELYKNRILKCQRFGDAYYIEGVVSGTSARFRLPPPMTYANCLCR